MNLSIHRNWQGTWRDLLGKEYYFFNGEDVYGPKRAHLPGFWTGSEGLAHPIRDRSGNKYVLKSFNFDCAERDQRMQWLCGKSLGSSLPVDLLRGAPYQYIPPPVQAQICPFVPGDTWAAIKDKEIVLTPDQRLWLACSLAQAVRVLEDGLQLSHSDLSPGNMLIDLGNGKAAPSIALIDFDAFHHRETPTLPVGKGQTLGTPGYQAPECLLQNRIVDSDRFSLAVHIHEFLAFQEDADLGEPDYLFFEQEDLNQGKARPTGRFKKYWGDTLYDLVCTALSAKSAGKRPSGEEWCEAFRNLGAGPDSQTSLIMTASKNGKRDRFDLQSQDIDLSKAFKNVPLQITRDTGGYQVSCRDKKCVAILEDPHTKKNIRLTPRPHKLEPGSKIVAAGWEFTFDAKSPDA